MLCFYYHKELAGRLQLDSSQPWICVSGGGLCRRCGWHHKLGRGNKDRLKQEQQILQQEETILQEELILQEQLTSTMMVTMMSPTSDSTSNNGITGNGQTKMQDELEATYPDLSKWLTECERACELEIKERIPLEFECGACQ